MRSLLAMSRLNAYMLVRRDWLQVIRLHAGRIAADMVKLLAFWNRPDKERVEKAMSGPYAAVVPDVAVMAVAPRFQPHDALAVWGCERIEQFLRRGVMVDAVTNAHAIFYQLFPAGLW